MAEVIHVSAIPFFPPACHQFWLAEEEQSKTLGRIGGQSKQRQYRMDDWVAGRKQNSRYGASPRLPECITVIFSARQ